MVTTTETQAPKETIYKNLKSLKNSHNALTKVLRAQELLCDKKILNPMLEMQEAIATLIHLTSTISNPLELPRHITCQWLWKTPERSFWLSGKIVQVTETNVLIASPRPTGQTLNVWLKLPVTIRFSRS